MNRRRLDSLSWPKAVGRTGCLLVNPSNPEALFILSMMVLERIGVFGQDRQDRLQRTEGSTALAGDQAYPDRRLCVVAGGEGNARMIRDASSAQGNIETAERQLAKLRQASAKLLDLVERFGTASMGPRVAEREAKRAQLQARVQRLQLQQEARECVVSQDTIETVDTGGDAQGLG